jgi:hypothetical protein
MIGIAAFRPRHASDRPFAGMLMSSEMQSVTSVTLVIESVPRTAVRRLNYYRNPESDWLRSQICIAILLASRAND